MSYLFSELQTEVARRAARDQSGSNFTQAVKNSINFAIFRIARESNWKSLHRKAYFNTQAPITGGTVDPVNGSTSWTGSGLNLITNGVQPGRFFRVNGSNLNYNIVTITGENAFTTDFAYDGTTTTGATCTVYGGETYNLPIQTGREAIIWHERYSFYYKMRYVPENAFFAASLNKLIANVPLYYHMWDQTCAMNQPLEASVVTAVSSSSADTTQSVSVFGTVAGYPDSETITLTGTTPVSGSKQFTYIDRVDKSASTTGRITLTTNSTNSTIAVIPTGLQTTAIEYKTIKIFPLPDSSFPINVYYYKQPYRLINDTDVHELGQEFDEAIILLATAKLKLEQNIDTGTAFMELYKDELKNLKKYNTDKLDWLPDLLRPENDGFNSNRINRFLSYQNLGGNFGPQMRM